LPEAIQYGKRRELPAGGSVTERELSDSIWNIKPLISEPNDERWDATEADQGDGAG